MKPVISPTDEWLALGHRLYEKGKAIFDRSSVLESEAGTKDTKVVALTLLARTMGNFQAAVLLLDNGSYRGSLGDGPLLLRKPFLDCSAH